MSRWVFFILGVALAVPSSLAVNWALDLRRESKALSLEEDVGSSRESFVALTDASPRPPLPLRLVDTGSVGIHADPDSWREHDYSHASLAFRDLETDDGFQRTEAEWRDYVDTMVAYGNNGVVVGTFLDLVDFDRVGAGDEIYAADSEIRRRHHVRRESFGRLFDYARTAGMRVYVKTDMLAMTPELADYLGGIDGGFKASNPKVWDVFRLGLEELFDRMELDGLLIRIGEAGSLYRDPLSHDSSAMFVRDAAGLQSMLQGILPAFDGTEMDLILRSWSVGVGELGELHTDPEVYERALGSIRSPNLIVSTKYVAGDYFSFFETNPTLFQGPHRRLVEFQSRREYEGFGAIPNFLGSVHQRALLEITDRNPNVVGIYNWTQAGGPQRAGPMSLYLRHGFWTWIDANVYATSRLGLQPNVSMDEVIVDWLELRFGDEPETHPALERILSESRQVIEDGLYLRPFAEQSRWIAGIELPPLMWIQEWDMLNGWAAISSIVYEACKPHLRETIADGYAAERRVEEWLHELESARTSVSRAHSSVEPDQGRQQPATDDVLASLRYHVDLLGLWAAHRESFLLYYDWMENGSPESRRSWNVARERFAGTAAEHRASYGDNLDFPAYELAPASRAMTAAGRGDDAMWLARFVLLSIVLALALGTAPLQRRTGWYAGKKMMRYLWIGAMRPWRSRGLRRDPSPPYFGLTSTVLCVCALTLVSLTSVSSWTLSLGVAIVVLVFIVGLKTGLTGPRIDAKDRFLPMAAVPLLIVCLPVLGALAWRGPLGFWHGFWTSETFRLLWVGALSLAGVWALYALWVVMPHGRKVPVRVLSAGLCLAFGSVLTLLWFVPDISYLLRLLDQPLLVVPMSASILTGITEYGGVGNEVLYYARGLGLALAAVGAYLGTGHRV